jgi:hypothetical protein
LKTRCFFVFKKRDFVDVRHDSRASPGNGVIATERHTANLLVVFLLVELYKLGGARSSKILRTIGGTCPRAAERQTFKPGRHDLVWILRETLATD